MTDLDSGRADTPVPLLRGVLVGRRYRLVDLAGAGGMATVWRAYDERLERPVAIKVISDALVSSTPAVARFASEARTHARIQHPNLVRLYDYSAGGKLPYLVMEYVNGCTLSERLDRGGFSETQLHVLATELLSAVACVHGHGVLHRDIKSGNVLLDADGHAHLADFGLAHLEDTTHNTRPHAVVGTLRFLAPELIEGRPPSRQSDLYALGVLLRTACGDTWPETSLRRVITWLTEHDPDARAGDARMVLAAMGDRQRRAGLPPTATSRRLRRPTGSVRHAAGKP